MFSKTTNRVHPSGSWKVLLVLQISSLEHSRNATLNDGQVSGGSNGNVPHRTPDPYYYYLTIYFRVPRHMLLTVQHKYVWFHLRLFLWLLSLLLLRNTSLRFFWIVSHPFYIEEQNAKCQINLSDAGFFMRSAVLCNDFQPWEKPWQHTCKTTIIFWIIQSAKYKVEFKVCNKTLIGRNKQ